MEQRHNKSPTNTMLVPYRHRDLAVKPPISASSRFRVPRGWGVEEVPRSDGSRHDTYYYEPGTGKKFRSTREVQRYLNGEEYYPTRRTTFSSRSHNFRYHKMLLYGDKGLETRRMIVSGGKLFNLKDEPCESHLAIVPSKRAAPDAPCILPDGWVVEEVPRTYNNGSDKYYYEPGTGQKFRSLVAVERYLEENAPLYKALEEINENKPLSKVFKLENHTKNSTSVKKKIPGENNEASSFNSPPMKVNWILASPQGDVWNPFISETLVPDSVKQQWADRFMIFMKDGNQ